MPGIKSVSDLVRQIKLAVQRAEGDLRSSDITIAKVELGIKATLEGSVSAGLQLKIVPVDLSATIQHSEIQTLRLELVPEPPTVELFASVADELSNAIRVVCVTAREAAATQPAFELTKATIELHIGVTSDGNIKVIVGGGVKEDVMQEVKLTLARSSKAPKASSGA